MEIHPNSAKDLFNKCIGSKIPFTWSQQQFKDSILETEYQDSCYCSNTQYPEQRLTKNFQMPTKSKHLVVILMSFHTCYSVSSEGESTLS